MPHRRQRAPILILALALCPGAAALAQGKSAPAAETPLSQCAAANRQALLELGQGAQEGQRRNVMNPMVVSRLQALQAQLGRLRETLPRTSRTLAECEQAGEAIAAERQRLLKLAGPDTEAAECLAGSQKLHGAVAQAYDAVQRSGGLPADQNAAFEASGSRLNRISAALARDSMLAADCRQLAEQIAQERHRVEGWAGTLGLAAPVSHAAPAVVVGPMAAVAAPTPPPGPSAQAAQGAAEPAAATAHRAGQAQACRDGQGRTYNSLAQSLSIVAQSSALAADKLVIIRSLSERLTTLRALLADRAAPGWDCDRVSQDLAQVHADLQPLLPPAR